jgi:hypothetical protein
MDTSSNFFFDPIPTKFVRKRCKGGGGGGEISELIDQDIFFHEEEAQIIYQIPLGSYHQGILLYGGAR